MRSLPLVTLAVCLTSLLVEDTLGQDFPKIPEAQRIERLQPPVRRPGKQAPSSVRGPMSRVTSSPLMFIVTSM